MFKDLTFKYDELNMKFNIRVAGIIVNNDEYLIQKSDSNDYYSLIGGRAQLGESTAETIIREIKEEIGISISPKDLKLIDVIENFFLLRGINMHELLFIYRITIPDNLRKDSYPTLDKDNSINTWFTKEKLNKLDLRPIIIKDLIQSTTLIHQIYKDNY